MSHKLCHRAHIYTSRYHLGTKGITKIIRTNMADKTKGFRFREPF